MIGKLWTSSRWSDKPEAIDIVSETEKTVIVRTIGWKGEPHECRRNKSGLDLYATWEEAKSAMIERAERDLCYAKEEVDRKQSKLETVKTLKKGTE